MKVALLRSACVPRLQALSLILILVALVWPQRASAGGLYLMPRGVEAAARGGARVAGSDDPQALWYNPAGLLSSGRQLLVDALLPVVRMDFQRALDNGSVEPRVSATSAIPIPTLAYTDNFGLKDWGFGIGLLVPTGFGGDWPDSVGGQPAPQRYSILDADNTYMATLALGVAYRPTARLSLGMALHITAAQVGATVAVSACDYAVCLQPEAKEWEGRTRFLLGPIYTASALFGAGYAFDRVKLGAALQLKTKIAGEAKFDVALPDQRIFDEVQLQNARGGDDLRADMEVALPMIVRLGAEVQPIKPLRMELAGSWENWSQQSSIVVDPKNVVARNVPGIGDVAADRVVLARNMRDTWSLGLGANYDLSGLVRFKRALFANGGLMYESSSFRNPDLSPTTVDTRKVMIGIGASVEVARNVLLDITYGHIFMQNRHVRNSRVLLPVAIRPLPEDDDPGVYEPGDRPAIGNGKYAMEADFVGLGVRWKLDPFRQRREARLPATPPSQPAVSAPAPAPTEAAPPAPEPAPELAVEPAPEPPAAPASEPSEAPAAPQTAPGEVPAAPEAAPEAAPPAAPGEPAPPAPPGESAPPAPPATSNP